MSPLLSGAYGRVTATLQLRHLYSAVAVALARLPGSDLLNDLVRVLDIELSPARSQFSEQIEQPAPLRFGQPYAFVDGFVQVSRRIGGDPLARGFLADVPHEQLTAALRAINVNPLERPWWTSGSEGKEIGASR